MASNYGINHTVYHDATMAAYWSNQSYINSPTRVSMAASALALSTVQVQFSRTEATGIREDVAEFSWSMFVNSGAIPPTLILDASQAAAVEGYLDTWWTAVKAIVQPHWLLTGYVWRHIHATGPISVITGNVNPSPAWRTTTRNVVATGSGGGQADQVAASVTLLTDSRRHWGRFYTPSPNASAMSSFSRFTTAAATVISDATDAAFNSMGTHAAMIVPVVWSPKYRGMMTVSAVKCDDVPDVIRRRRAKVKTFELRHDNTA